MVDTSLKTQHLYVVGNSGTGKSSIVKEEIKKARRVICFDPEGEYADMTGFVKVFSAEKLLDVILEHQHKALKVAFVAEGQKAFDVFCEMAFAWGDCVAIAEEIADVTTVSKAPPAWGKVIRRGRKHGIKVIAITQRASEADKTILSNCATLRVFALGRTADRQAIAREIDYSVDELTKMIPLEYIDFKREDLSLTAGKLGTRGVKKLR